MLIAFTKHARCFSNLFLSSYWKFVPFDDHFLCLHPSSSPTHLYFLLSFRLTFSGSPGDVTQYLSVCTWLIPLSTPPTFPCATINDRMSFCLPGCLDHTFTIHLAPVRYIRSFLILAGMNTAGMNPGMQLSLQRTHFNSWYHITRRRASKSHSNSTFVFARTFHISSQCGTLLYVAFLAEGLTLLQTPGNTWNCPSSKGHLF